MKIAQFLEIKRYEENYKLCVGGKELEIFATIKVDTANMDCESIAENINKRFKMNYCSEQDVRQQIFDDKLFVFEDGIIICF